MTSGESLVLTEASVLTLHFFSPQNPNGLMSPAGPKLNPYPKCYNFGGGRFGLGIASGAGCGTLGKPGGGGGLSGAVI